MDECSAESADGERRKCGVAVLEVRGRRVVFIARRSEHENCGRLAVKVKGRLTPTSADHSRRLSFSLLMSSILDRRVSCCKSVCQSSGGL